MNILDASLVVFLVLVAVALLVIPRLRKSSRGCCGCPSARKPVHKSAHKPSKR